MAPARTSSRRAHPEINNSTHPSPTEPQDGLDIDEELFIDPMLGSPLSMYIEKDVEDREVLMGLITKYGGTVAQGYSGVPYILVDPHKVSGQNLYRQYAGKKGKIVLDSRWVHECVKAKQLQTFHSNYAGCKVTGSEVTPSVDIPTDPSASGGTNTQQSSRRRGRQGAQVPPPPTVPSHPVPVISTVDPIVYPQFPYPVYGTSMHPQTRSIHPVVATAPPQTWQAPNGIAPQQTHIHPPPAQAHMLHRPHYRDSPWDGYETASGDAMSAPPPAGCGYGYREDQNWPPYDDTPFEPQYEQPANYIEDPSSSTGEPSSALAGIAEKQPPRRRRAATQSTSATPASTLVLNRNPPARSPTPPTRVIKSTYGGNLFTADDVYYLKRYIDYCQEQGLVLSLREICERIAVKAPHHTFYSWRRYCNKHQIRLGGYMMNPDRSESPNPVGDQDVDEEEPPVASLRAGPGPGTIAAAQQRASNDGPRNRSPTPPRALFRSTTGKGVAFTDEDVTFLVRFMEYRKSQGRLDMVAFWKDVAIKAPHHSRASWMKFWRRHKHELNRTETDDPLPQPPDKKMRYSRDDDILLAKFFIDKPEGTSDKIFQAFGRMHSHHPWKGWQEHHRIHKAKIDHFMQKLAKGETLDRSMRSGQLLSYSAMVAAMLEYLTEEQINQLNFIYSYLVVPGFLGAHDTEALLSRSKGLLDEFEVDNHPLTKFTTSDKDHVGDEYFLNSGDKIRYFLEEDAVDKNGNLTREKQKAVNKIGHALHVLEPAFRKVTLENQRLRALVRDLKFHHEPVALQSMVITKQTHIGGEVPEHNDSTFLYTDPPTALGFWIALEKCTPENGALSFLPGSHLTTPITKRFVRLPGGGTGFERLVPQEVEKTLSEKPKGKYILEACSPGDLVLIHGSVLHKSERNTSPNTRFAYTFHMIDSPPFAAYDSKNWLQPTSAMPFSRILESEPTTFG